MKKILVACFMAGFLLLTVESVNAQARKQFNIGLIGVAYDIPIATDIALTPFAGTNFDLSWLTAGVKVNYYFDNLLGFPDEFDLYGGANAGYAFAFVNNSNANDFDIGLQIGFRYFWSEKMGIYLEGGGGKIGATGGLGLTIRM